MDFSRFFNLHYTEKEKGSAPIIMGLMITAAVFLFLLPNLWLRTEQYTQVSEITTSKEAGFTLNQSATRYFVEELESENIFICGHNVIPGDSSNSLCTSATNDQILITSKPAVASYDFKSTGAGHATFSVCSPRSSDLRDHADTLYGSAAKGFAVSEHSIDAGTCKVEFEDSSGTKVERAGIRTSVNIEEIGTSQFLKVEAETNATVTSGQTTKTVLATRFTKPNTCASDETMQIVDTDPFSDYKMTLSKKPKKIKNKEEFAAMKKGGHYELESDIELSDTETLPPMKNVYLNGKGHKIKVKKTKCDEDTVGGLMRSIDCGVITDVVVDVDETSGVCGDKCVGGIVGIIRRSLVANSKVNGDADGNGFADGKIKGKQGVGGAVGCIDNCGFWNSRVTRIFADAVVAVKDSPDTTFAIEDFGGAIGVNKGFVEGVYTASQLVSYLTDVLSIDVENFGGIAGRNGGPGSECGSAAEDTPGIIANSKSESSITDKDSGGNTKTKINDAGGIVGEVVAGKVQDSYAQDKGGTPVVIGAHGDNTGGAIGNIKPGNNKISRDPETNNKLDPNTIVVDKVHAEVKVGVDDKGKNKGGLVGNVDTTTPGGNVIVQIEHSYASGDKEIHGEDKVGGLIGNVGGGGNVTLNQDYADNKVTCTGACTNQNLLVGNPNVNTTCTDAGGFNSCFAVTDNGGTTTSDSVTVNLYTNNELQTELTKNPPNDSYGPPYFEAAGPGEPPIKNPNNAHNTPLTDPCRSL